MAHALKTALLLALLTLTAHAQIYTYFPPPGLTYDGAGGLGVLDLTLNGAAGGGVTEFAFNNRTAVSTFPAAFVRPTTTNTVMAFDVMPNGSPTEQPLNGFAWHDVCDTDSSIGNPPMHCLRIGAMSTGMEVGSRDFNGATELPLLITVHEITVETCHSTSCAYSVPVTASNIINGGTFTGTISAGCTTTPSGTFTYSRAGNIVTITNPSGALTCTSNTTGLTLSGIPAAITPAHDHEVAVQDIEDGGNTQLSGAVDITATGTMTFFLARTNIVTNEITMSNSVFTASGTKGIAHAVFSVTYSLD